jgi:hypothetical protein
MIDSVLHPSARTLSSFATHDIDAGVGRYRRVQSHLSRCERCRGEVSAIRDVVARANAASQPSMRDDALARVLAACERGDTVLLPVDLPRRTPTERRGLARASAAAAVLLVVVVFSWTSSNQTVVAAAVAGELKLSPAAPGPGAHIMVSYRPAEPLARFDTLVLRARLRTPHDEQYQRSTRQHVVATLVRSGSSFVGAFDLPRDVVYAVFAVEDPQAKIVDAHGGRLWGLLVYTDSKPSLDALRQEFNDVIDRSPDSALSIVRRTTDLYPESPRAWANRIAFESFMLGGGFFDSTNAEHRDRVQAFDRALRARDARSVTAEEMASVADYAVQVSTRQHPEIGAITTYWRARLLADASGSPLRGERQIGDYNSRVLRDTAIATRVLDSVELIWQRGDSLNTMTAQFGLQIAQRAHDSAAVMRWIDREGSRAPETRSFLLMTSALRDRRLVVVAVAQMRARATQLERRDDAFRPLEASTSEDAYRRARERRAVFANLGNTLLQAGDTSAAQQALANATEEGWDSALFARTAVAYVRTGDTANATRMAAFVAVDPSTRKETADSLARQFTRFAGDSAWGRALVDARRELARRVLSESMNRTIPGGGVARLVASSGDPMDLARLTRGKISVVAFWSRFCGIARVQLPLYAQLDRDLAARGIVFVPVAVEAPSTEATAFGVRIGSDFRSYFDLHGDARRAFDNIGTPTYYVLDEAGRLRFESNSPTLALTQAVALKDANE